MNLQIEIRLFISWVSLCNQVTCLNTILNYEKFMLLRPEQQDSLKVPPSVPKED